MTAKNFSTVTQDVIAAYGNTAKNVIHAYQAGGERVVTLLEQRWDRAFKQSRAQLTAEVAQNASAARKAFTGYYTGGLNATAKGAQGVVTQIVKLSSTGVDRVAANAAKFEVKTGVTTLNTLAKASLPGVVALSALATQIEQKSADLARKVAGDKVVAATGKRASAFRNAKAVKAA